MSRPNPLILMGIIVVLTAGLGWTTLMTGGFYLSSHEGDTYHLLDILFRMNAGQWPHLDFVTPLGFLGFLPFVAFMSEGYPVGQAMLWGQVATAIVFAPFVFYVAYSRLNGWVAYLFAAILMVTVLAISYGGTGAGLSMSMHYNRWAWVVASMIVVAALIPRYDYDEPLLDGILFGLLFSALAMTKVTFFVALLPGIVVALASQGRGREILVTFVVGVLVAGGLAYWLSPDFFLAYLADLLNVSGSKVRPHTGLDFAEIIGSARFIGVSSVGFLAFLFLHRAGHRAPAIGMILLLPGFLFMTWQNFGNDPKWLIPLAAVLITLATANDTEKAAEYAARLRTLAALAAILILPSVMTMSLSPLRHAGEVRDAFEPMLAESGPESTIYVRRDRGFSMLAEQFRDDPGDVWANYADMLDREAPTEINGIPFPHCEFLAGSTGWMRTLAGDLRGLGVEEGAALFTTDILSAFWLYEPFTPLPGGAPWYYGDLSGIENADYVVVPKCGFAERVRQIIISDLAGADLEFETIAETERLALFRVAQ